MIKRTKQIRYWSRSQVDGRRLALVSLSTIGVVTITFARSTKAELKLGAAARKYTVSYGGMCVKYTSDFREALRAHIISVHRARQVHYWH